MPPEFSPRCHRHEAVPAVGACHDCGERVCALCAIDLPEVGISCGECATRRAGVHHRRSAHGVHGAGPDGPPPVPSSRLRATEDPVDVARFEAHVAARRTTDAEDLGHRLEDAGLDADGAVLDDAAILEEITHLQDEAAVAGEAHRWRPHHRSLGPDRPSPAGRPQGTAGR